MKPHLLFLMLLPAMSLAATPAEIDRAVKELGAPEFKTREAASKFLSTAGTNAIPALEKAVQSTDPEVQTRAKEILPALRLNVPLDVPVELRRALADYEGASVAKKQTIVNKLADRGLKLRPVLVALAESEKNASVRREVFGRLAMSMMMRMEQAFEGGKPKDESWPSLLDEIEFSQSIFPEFSQIMMMGMQEMTKDGEKKKAEELFERMYKVMDKQCTANPKDAEMQNGLAWMCAVARRRLDEGLKWAEAALKQKPEQPRYLDTKAELLFQKGQKEKAIELMEKCIKLDPKFDYYEKQLERFKKGDPSVPPPEVGNMGIPQNLEMLIEPPEMPEPPPMDVEE